jgi:hypothetical protein
MDFGFTNGGDAHINSLRGMFTRRATTTLVAARGVTAVAPLLSHLDTTTSITKPIGDLLFGAHANDEGELFMPSFPGQNGPTVFETLEETLNDPTKSIQIPDPLIGFTTGSQVTHAVHIKGCNIGKARPFLVKLKAALGGHVRVTAPKFFHGATPAPNEGSFEYLGYQFAIRRATAFPNRAAALTEFDTAQFRLIDNTVVPTADWNRLIPGNPNLTVRQQIPSRLGVTIGRRATINTAREYRATGIGFGPWIITYPPQATVPTTETAKLADLKTSIRSDPRFDDTHAFPVYKREGFATFNDFFSGYDWTCNPARGKRLICTGSRILYVILLAVTDPATTPPNGFFGDGNLIFNFYPNAGSTLPARTTALQVTDPRFFETV